MLNSQQKMELVDLLAACPLMQDRATRAFVIVGWVLPIGLLPLVLASGISPLTNLIAQQL